MATKKTPLTFRSRDHLKTARKLYSEAWAKSDLFHADRGKTYQLARNDAACRLLAGTGSSPAGEDDQLFPAMIGDVGRLAAFAAWRVTQVSTALIRRYTLKSSIPRSMAIFRTIVPHAGRCVDIETPDLPWLETPLHAFFAHLERMK